LHEKEKIVMKTPQEGQWVAHMVKRIARAYLKDMKRAMERHALGNSTLATMLIVMILLGSCGALDNGTGSNGSSDNGTDFAGQHIHIVGSTALLPLAAKAVDLFHQQHPEVIFDAQGGGSVTGLNAVTSHQADIGDSDIYADPTLYSDPNLTDHIVCVNVFILMINPQVNVSSLNTQQVINIFTGVITKRNMSSVPEDDEQLRPEVRTRYAKAALRVPATEPLAANVCCGPSCCPPSTFDSSSITSDLYSQMELDTHSDGGRTRVVRPG